ncbi:MAG: flagellar hook basal-body protein [Dehalococcoidia bacterium]
MIKGLYTSVSGLAAAEARQRVLAHNIANVNATGYKADDVTAESFESLYTALFDPATPGGGAQSAGRRYDLSQGAFQETGAPLDLALDGPGFFVLIGPDGPQYTRAGRFTRDADGVVRSPDGLAVQDSAGRPLTVTGTDLRVGPDGAITADGAPAGRLRVIDLDGASLTRAGAATFTSAAVPTPAAGRVVAGALERSNVDVTAVMTTMTMMLRAFEAGRQAVQLQNETLNATVNNVGSVR